MKINNKEFLVEVKSTKFLPKEPKKDNIMQLQFYMFATKIWNGLLVYIQKDNLQTKTFPILCRKETITRIMNRFENLHNSLANNQMPIAEAKMSDDTTWMCDYCPYRDECDQEGRL